MSLFSDWLFFLVKYGKNSSCGWRRGTCGWRGDIWSRRLFFDRSVK
ncbi:hypothetical protein GvMRE_Ic5gS550 [endosymbiont GvMRE of Glomus versiforme]|nr:hypothetical protein GvMRE_Ic5gS550 [endosymbiont GvMRE of Glomus versiforme]